MLKGKNVIIVGGTAGIGRAVAGLAREQGARVVIAARQAPPAGARPFEFCPCDIAGDEDFGPLLAATGPIDHLVITARPALAAALVAEIDLAAARQAYETKLWGPLRLIRQAQPHIRGSIVLTSGIAGEKVYPGAAIMATLNAAVEALGRALAVELAPLRVNVVSPGFVAPKPDAVAQRAHAFPVPGLIAPEALAQAYLYLMANPALTGTISVVDGGARLV